MPLRRLERSKIVELRLRGLKLQDAEAIVLGDYLALCSSLQLLDLSRNKIGAEGGTSIAKAIVTTTALEQLSLQSNALLAEGA